MGSASRQGKALALIFLLLLDHATAMHKHWKLRRTLKDGGNNQAVAFGATRKALASRTSQPLQGNIARNAVRLQAARSATVVGDQAEVKAPAQEKTRARPKRVPRVVEALKFEGLAERVQAQLAKARAEGPTRPLRPELANAAKKIRQQVYEATLAALTAPAAPVPAATTKQAAPVSLLQEDESSVVDPSNEVDPVDQVWHSYAGCHSDDLERTKQSCMVESDIYYFGCSRSLVGNIAEKAQKCYTMCATLPGYIAFSIYDSSACICTKTHPSVKDATIAATNCPMEKANVVYHMKAWFSYMGCGSADFQKMSCIPDSDVLWAGCSRSLAGPISDKAANCYQQCATASATASSDYVAFSVYDSSVCLCSKQLPTDLTNIHTPSDTCLPAKNSDDPAQGHIVYSMQVKFHEERAARMCNKGRTPVEAACLHAGKKLLSNMDVNYAAEPVLIKDNLGDIPAGCLLEAADGEWNIHFNAFPNGQADTRYSLVCSEEWTVKMPYHLEPAGITCDSGFVPKEEHCLFAANNMMDSLPEKSARTTLLKGEWADLPKGCSISTETWIVHWNTHDDGEGNIKHSLVCTGEKDESFNHLEENTALCRDGEAVTREDCLAGGKKLVNEIGHTVGSDNLNEGTFDHIPTGCSVHSKGDWTVHFNNKAPGQANADFSLLCTELVLPTPAPTPFPTRVTIPGPTPPPLADLGSYAGCHSAHVPPTECTPGAPAYLFGCARSLSEGTVFEKARKCSRDCAGLDNYKAFAIYDESSCICLQDLPPVTSTSIPADLCEQKLSHLIYSQQVLPGDGLPGSQQRATMHVQQHVLAKAEATRVTVQSMTCNDIIANVVQASQNARSILGEMCGSTSCQLTSSTRQTEQLINVAQQMTALSGQADKQLCLIDVMTHAEVKAGVQNVLSYVDRVLQSGSNAEVNARMEKAYRRMLAWQFGTMDLAKRIADRKMLLPTNIEDRSVCPQECDSCTKQHNSFWKGSEQFKFKCILIGASSVVPTRDGMTCDPKKLRNTFWLGRWDQYKTWCAVDHWKERVCQDIHVEGVTKCGAETITSALMTDETDYAPTEDQYLPLLHRHCMDVEQGVNAISQEDKDKYMKHIDASDDEVQQWIKQLFGLVLSFGIANGLGAMRMAAVGNEMQNDHRGKTVATSAAEVPSTIIDPFVLGRSIDTGDRTQYGNANLGDCKILVVDEKPCVRQGFERSVVVIAEAVRWLAFIMLGSGIGMLLSVPITSAGMIVQTMTSRMYLGWAGDSLKGLMDGGSFSVVRMFTMMLAGAGVPQSIDNPIPAKCNRFHIPGITPGLLQLDQNETNSKTLFGYDSHMIPLMKQHPLLSMVK